MTATAVPHPMLASGSPSLKLPWMQALIHAGAQLAQPDEVVTEAKGDAKDAVHYVLCGSGPGTVEAGTDFLTAVAKARRLVATGARRIVFLTFGDTQEGRMHQSLISFARHAGRALTANPAEFAVIPLDRPSPGGPLLAEPLSRTPQPSREDSGVQPCANGLISRPEPL
ncbi:hypothetical protein [Pseudotabrizicola sp. 4114]|uniref:hypothetical protein n=1 Tax=Pseudotabrizicola sp. 4114 TaxID=2817731 RepID=UPI00286104E5|nr:hypothetical protein [Pseudorhodobacter sp. 4114]